MTSTDPGALGPADDEYRGFEATFPFDETVDQSRAIDDVNHDLESERPMDRLVCGDVGFGKTEVALRAAFRVAMAVTRWTRSSCGPPAPSMSHQCSIASICGQAIVSPARR